MYDIVCKQLETITDIIKPGGMYIKILPTIFCNESLTPSKSISEVKLELNVLFSLLKCNSFYFIVIYRCATNWKSQGFESSSVPYFAETMYKSK